MGGPGGPGGGGMADIFEMFAGGGRGRGGGPRERKGENVVHRLKVSLEDMFRGTTRYGDAGRERERGRGGARPGGDKGERAHTPRANPRP
jgi:DnaJ-class molecular chaperone